MDSQTENRRAKLLAGFFRRLKAIRGQFKWRLDEFGQVRGQHLEYYHLFCPITALLFTSNGLKHGGVHEAAEQLGLRDVCIDLVDAIDNNGGQDALREGLLRTLRLHD